MAIPLQASLVSVLLKTLLSWLYSFIKISMDQDKTRKVGLYKMGLYKNFLLH